MSEERGEREREEREREERERETMLHTKDLSPLSTERRAAACKQGSLSCTHTHTLLFGWTRNLPPPSIARSFRSFAAAVVETVQLLIPYHTQELPPFYHYPGFTIGLN